MSTKPADVIAEYLGSRQLLKGSPTLTRIMAETIIKHLEEAGYVIAPHAVAKGPTHEG